MRFRTYRSFDRDFSRLPSEHRKAFYEIVQRHFLPAIAAGSFTGQPPWPSRLRRHEVGDGSIYSLTWSFASPHGWATFHLEKDVEGGPLLVWRRIGNHSLYERP